MRKTPFFVMMLFLFVFFSNAEETVLLDSTSIADSSAVDSSVTVMIESVSEPKPVLTEAQKRDNEVCKKAAQMIEDIYDNWSPERDFIILKPRLEDEISDFYEGWMEPVESLKENYQLLDNSFKDLMKKDMKPLIKELADNEYARVKNVISGNYSNPALPGYTGQTETAFIKLLLENLKKDDKYSDIYSELNYAYRNIFRVSIEFDRLNYDLFAESSRLIDKRLNSFYIEDELADDLKKVAAFLGDYVREREPEIVASFEKSLSELETQKDKLKEELAVLESNDASDEVIAAKEAEYKSVFSSWVETRKTVKDDLLKEEVGRLVKVVQSFLDAPGEFVFTQQMILDFKDGKSNDENFITQYKYRFFSPLVSKFQFYFTFDVVNGFKSYRTNVLIISILFFLLFFYLLLSVRKKKDAMYIRKITGLDAIDEAVGRATEMGKPVFYDSGIDEIKNPQTIASMLILKYVAKRVAEFKAEIYFPAYDPVVMQVADEMIHTGYLDAGVPEDYKRDNVFFLTNDQFAYASGLSGLTARKKPASCFHFGAYAAESLLIAEAGFAAGAIQVAGTVQSTQLPFFIAACDHTLIGEELFAAAAYLSRDPGIVSNLKISDYAKIVFGFLFLLSTLLLTINSEWRFLIDLLETK